MRKFIRVARRACRACRACCVTALALCAAVVPAAQAAGKVDVQWLEPATYSDAGRSASDRQSAMQALGAHLQKLARLLPEGQTLTLEITDLDLAGKIEPVGWHELRVVRGRADWPRMELRFALTQGARTLRSGQARLQDMGYPFGPRSEALGDEKRMIDRWFKAEFAAP